MLNGKILKIDECVKQLFLYLRKFREKLISFFFREVHCVAAYDHWPLRFESEKKKLIKKKSSNWSFIWIKIRRPYKKNFKLLLVFSIFLSRRNIVCEYAVHKVTTSNCHLKIILLLRLGKNFSKKNNTLEFYIKRVIFFFCLYRVAFSIKFENINGIEKCL